MHSRAVCNFLAGVCPCVYFIVVVIGLAHTMLLVYGVHKHLFPWILALLAGVCPYVYFTVFVIGLASTMLLVHTCKTMGLLEAPCRILPN